MRVTTMICEGYEGLRESVPIYKGD